MMNQNIKYYLITAAVIIMAVFFIGRASKSPETIYIESPSDDSLRIELNNKIETIREQDSLLDLWSLEIDSLISDGKFRGKRTKVIKKKQYENTQKMSLDSAVVARNILLDSAINSQSRIREAKSDSSN